MQMITKTQCLSPNALITFLYTFHTQLIKFVIKYNTVIDNKIHDEIIWILTQYINKLEDKTSWILE